MENHQKKQHPTLPVAKTFMVLGLIGIICLCIAFVLSFRVVHTARQRPLPRPKQTTNISLIQEWMTIRYIAHTYNVPEEEFMQQFALTKYEVDHLPVEKIAKKRKQETSALILQIKQIITNFHATHPDPST